MIFTLVSCKKDSEYYNNLYFKGKIEKDIKILQQGFEKAEPYFSQLCAKELCNLLPKQKAVKLAQKATKIYPESLAMEELFLSLLYDQRNYSSIVFEVENLENFPLNHEITRYYFSALINLIHKGKNPLDEDLRQKINSWYKENQFSESHNTFYTDFSTQLDFDPIITARHYFYEKNYLKAATTIENQYSSKEKFLQFLSSLSYIEIKDLGDSFVYGSSDKIRYSEYFATAALSLPEPNKAFYSLFSAGRLHEKVYPNSSKNLDYYRTAIYLAEEDSFDRALWYYIRAAINFSTTAGYQAFLDFSNAWKDPYYFDDVVELFSANLLSKYQWESYFDLFSTIYPYLSPTSKGKTDYILGSLIDANLIPSKNDSDFAKEYYKKAFSNVETEGYYRIMAGVKLGEKLELASSNSKNINKLKSPEEKYLSYLMENDISQVYSFYLENQENINSEVALEAVLALEEAGEKENEYFPVALRLATAAISDESLVKHLYPRYFTEYVETTAEDFNLPENILYGLIRTESYFQHSAKSSAGALGLCQLMPLTAGDVAKKLKIKEYDLFDPKTSITFGAYYLGELTNRLDGNILLALLSYNGGIENVRKWKRQNPSLPIDIFLETVPFEETRNYGRKLIKSSVLYGMIYYQLSPEEIISTIGIF